MRSTIWYVAKQSLFHALIGAMTTMMYLLGINWFGLN